MSVSSARWWNVGQHMRVKAGGSRGLSGVPAQRLLVTGLASLCVFSSSSSLLNIFFSLSDILSADVSGNYAAIICFLASNRCSVAVSCNGGLRVRRSRRLGDRGAPRGDLEANNLGLVPRVGSSDSVPRHWSIGFGSFVLSLWFGSSSSVPQVLSLGFVPSGSVPLGQSLWVQSLGFGPSGSVHRVLSIRFSSSGSFPRVRSLGFGSSGSVHRVLSIRFCSSCSAPAPPGPLL